jgi:polysaccharide biosynthesis transport protein
MSRDNDRTHQRRESLLWRRRWLIVGTTLVVAVVGLGVSLLGPNKYEASTDILVETASPGAVFSPDLAAGGDPVRRLQTEIQLVQSEAVRAAVRRKLERKDTPAVVVESVGQSDVIRIEASDTDATTAASIANAYAEAYIEARKATAAAGENALQQQIADITRQIDDLDRQVSASPADQQATLTQRTASSRDSLVAERSALAGRLRELRVDGAIEGGGARILVPATTPDSAVQPTPLLSMAIGLAVGAALGCGLALLADHLDARRGDRVEPLPEMVNNGRRSPNGAEQLAAPLPGTARRAPESVREPRG